MSKDPFQDLIRIAKEMKISGGHITIKGRRKDIDVMFSVANINPNHITFDLTP